MHSVRVIADSRTLSEVSFLVKNRNALMSEEGLENRDNRWSSLLVGVSYSYWLIGICCESDLQNPSEVNAP